MTKTKVTDYFNGNLMSQDVWQSKYAMKDSDNNIVEDSPDDMHLRMAKEFARIEYKYKVRVEINNSGDNFNSLSDFGKKLIEKREIQSESNITDEIHSFFKNFGRIIPQGSIMSNLGNPYIFGSLSNCFGIAPPQDSYGGIMKTDQEIVQLQKRRGGVGVGLNNLRTEGATVTNAAKTSTGVVSFGERFSNTTREVAQGGRRGALMLLLLCKHPSIFKFVTAKDDRTKITGANLTTMLTDEFMKAVESEDDRFWCTFPVDVQIDDRYRVEAIEFNKIYNNIGYKKISIMKIHAKELFDLIAEMAWKNGEPGVAFIDRVQDYCPDGVYKQYKPTVCNPCAEQWFSVDETCRLIAQNFFTIVDNPFTRDAKINIERLYEQSYMQQRLGDDLVDLEVEHIDRIIDKIKSDPEDEDTKSVELNLWKRIRMKAIEGRRTGGGFTGLGDMLAALNLKYDSDEALQITELVMKTKMEAELDATIDMAILRGTFTGWDNNIEYPRQGESYNEQFGNSWYKMVAEEFPVQCGRMQKYGRRNISMSTVAPTGTVSLMTQTTSGIEPLFKAYYIRRKKINPSEEGNRVDFVDQNGDKWMEYAVLHPKFKEWLQMQISGSVLDEPKNLDIDFLSKEEIQNSFKQSPWYGSEADDISWQKRITMQAVVQKYTTNAISSTINLPKNIDKEIVKSIYFAAYKAGLKGVTVYRDGSRSGVLVTETAKTTLDEFGYNDAPKRPEELEADYYFAKSMGREYAVIVGKLNGNPYELFAFADPLIQENLKGKIGKAGTGHYTFVSNGYVIENLQLNSDHKEEVLLTRMTSLLLRHGANPKFVVQQVHKTDLQITSFAKVIARVLKNYIPDENTKEECPECHEKTMVYEEGCKSCKSCGYSKC